MRSAQPRSFSTSDSRREPHARGPSMSIITMIVRMVMTAATRVAAAVTAPMIVCWFPIRTLTTCDGVMARMLPRWRREGR